MTQLEHITSSLAQTGRSVPGWPGWALVAGLLFVPQAWPRWAVMWLLAATIFFACKWLTWHRLATDSGTRGRRIGYWVAWPGLDARSFLDPRQAVAAPTKVEWFAALSKLAVGIVLLGATAMVSPVYPYAIGWVGMVGIVLVLHFGIFHLLSCAWRAGGVAARPLMRWPLLATSLAEFWGRRWNTAFRDLTHRFLFRPLSQRLPARVAVCAGFAFSGLVHDLVISFPAGGGWGGPTSYFVLQGAGVLFERSPAGRAAGLGAAWRGWLFTMVCLLAPLPLLFHRPFVVRVVVPFLQALGIV